MCVTKEGEEKENGKERRKGEERNERKRKANNSQGNKENKQRC